MLKKIQDINQIHLDDYRLVVFDIDGTLIGRGRPLPDFTKITLLRLRKHGLDFTLATGKTLPATQPLADDLEIDLPLILCNGALIQTRQRKILDRTSLPLAVTREVTEICARQNQDLVVYIDEGLYVRQLTENMLPIYGEVETGLHEVGDWEALGDRLALANKCLAVDTREQKKLAALEGDFLKAVGNRADVLRSSEELLEVMPKDVTKASGLLKLTDLLDIEMHEVMAFGDYDNDAAMLAAAGLGAAVEGASQAAISNADILVGACDQEGPAKFLAEILNYL